MKHSVFDSRKSHRKSRVVEIKDKYSSALKTQMILFHVILFSARFLSYYWERKSDSVGLWCSK